MPDTYKLYTDGSCNLIETCATFGGYIVHPDGKIIHRFYGQLSRNRNPHEYELTGLLYGLKECIKLGISSVECCMDDQILCEIMSTTNPELIKKYCEKIPNRREVFNLFPYFKHIGFQHILNGDNTIAHNLSKAALHKFDNNSNRRRNYKGPEEDIVITRNDEIELYINALKKIGNDSYQIGMDWLIDKWTQNKSTDKKVLQQRVFTKLMNLIVSDYMQEHKATSNMQKKVQEYKEKLKNQGINLLF